LKALKRKVKSSLTLSKVAKPTADILELLTGNSEQIVKKVWRDIFLPMM
jgi:hypothetical protein